MCPNLTSPIILNAAINATLNQPPQSWWASTTMSALITASVTLLAVYLGQRWTKSSERKRDFLKARRQAYYRYITVFSDAMRIREWPPSLISEKLPILYKSALEAGEYGDNNDWVYVNPKAIINPGRSHEDDYLQDKFDPKTGISSKCVMKNGFLAINSFYGFIELIEFLMELYDPSTIDMNCLADVGNGYIPVFRNILLNEWERPWQLWIKKMRDRLKKDHHHLSYSITSGQLSEKLNPHASPGKEEVEKKRWRLHFFWK